MYNNIFDSHAHYNDHAFDEDRDEVISSLGSNGIKYVMNAGCNTESNESGIKLCEKYDFFYCAVGIHPSDISDYDASCKELMIKQSQHEKVKAIGEIGLDYFYGKENVLEQKRVFEDQLALAKDLDMPVIIHDRDAHQDTLDLLKFYRPKGIVHCFSGSAEFAKEILRLGMNIGFTGVLTFKNARRAIEALSVIPTDRLLLETDCPYMSPEPHRGTRCDSRYIPFTAEKMAQVKGESTQKILDITCQNAQRIYNID